MKKMNIEQILNKANFYKRKKLEEDFNAVRGIFLDFFEEYRSEIEQLSVSNRVFIVCRLIKIFKLEDIDSIKVVIEMQQSKSLFDEDDWNKIKESIEQWMESGNA